MKRGHVLCVILLTATAMGLTACDWDFGTHADQTNEANAWVNFAGVYHAFDPATEDEVVPGTGVTVFNVTQDGNVLRFIDNHGSQYEGTLGNVRTTGGTEDWTQAYAQFVVRGRSVGEGKMVTITGTLQAETDDNNMAQRYMYGSWLEEGGLTREVNGQANPVDLP